MVFQLGAVASTHVIPMWSLALRLSNQYKRGQLLHIAFNRPVCVVRRKMESAVEQPLFAFGIIADCQYGDDVNGQNFTRTRTRYISKP